MNKEYYESQINFHEGNIEFNEERIRASRRAIKENKDLLKELKKADLVNELWDKFDPHGIVKPIIEAAAQRVKDAPSLVKGTREQTANALLRIVSGKLPYSLTRSVEDGASPAQVRDSMIWYASYVLEHDHSKKGVAIRKDIYTYECNRTK